MTAQELLERYIAGERNFRFANLHGANLHGANLRGAILGGANLHGADLRGAILGGANLHGADLPGANLRGAILHGADLRGAGLSDANLHGADLGGANLGGANLHSADLRGAYLGAPPAMLLAYWSDLSDALTRAAMRYDAANHPKPEKFLEWARGGACPYNNLKISRCVNFAERRELFTPDLLDEKPMGAYELMVAIIREKCADSDYHEGKQ